MTYTYSYTVTTYSYNCQVCGTRSSGVPRMSEIPRCLICDISLCKHCFQHGFCPTHWKLLPEDLQGQLIQMHQRVETRKKVGFIGFAFFLIIGLILIMEAGANDFIDVGLPIFFVLLLLSIICVAGSVSPINTLRKREQKFLAPILDSVKNRSGQSQVPPFSVPPLSKAQDIPATGPKLDASKKYCSYCGAIINKDAVFCEKCGANLVS